MTPKEIELYSLPGMQKLFREKMGEPIKGDKYRVDYKEYFIGDCVYWMECTGKYGIPEKSILHPLPIDPINPERGLLGMMREHAFLNIHPHYPSETWDCKWQRNSEVFTASGSTPTEALLRALMAQEGIKE